MANITITATALKPGKGTQPSVSNAGESIAHGDIVHINPANQNAVKSDNTASRSGVNIAMALSAGDATSSVVLMGQGDVHVGSVLTAGEEYYLSATPGKICPKADLVTGDNIIRVGIAKTSSILSIRFDPTGVVVP